MLNKLPQNVFNIAYCSLLKKTNFQKFILLVMSSLLAFNISDGVWPPYTSQLIFEIYEMSDNSFSMRILYNGKVMKMPFCNNQEMCNTDTVKAYTATFLPESVEKDCY